MFRQHLGPASRVENVSEIIWHVFRSQNRYLTFAEYAAVEDGRYQRDRVQGGGDSIAPPFVRREQSSSRSSLAPPRIARRAPLGALNGQQGKDAAGERQGKGRQGSGRPWKGI